MLIGIVVFIVANCSSQQKARFYDNSIKVDSLNVPLNRNQFYFPVTLVPKTAPKKTKRGIPNIREYPIRNTVDSSYIDLFSSTLWVMKEPLIFNRKLNKEIYRFIWLRAFDNPIVVRIEKKNMEVILFWKTLGKYGNYALNEIVANKSKKVFLKDWSKFKSILDSTQFWQMTRVGNGGTDGSEWALEGIDSTRYNVATYWSPSKDSGFYRICNFLLELTDLKLEEKDKY